MQHDEFEDNLPEKPSKTQRKREMEALQTLGESLLAYPIAKLKAIPLPDELLKALEETRHLSMRKAGRRQMQYIGRLMRELDADTLEAVHQFIAERKRGR